MLTAIVILLAVVVLWLWRINQALSGIWLDVRRNGSTVVDLIEDWCDEAASRGPRKPRRSLVVDWLEERFRERREWDSVSLLEEARAFGFSRDVLFSESSRSLPIRRVLRIAPDGSRKWYWTAEDGWPGAKSGASSFPLSGEVTHDH